MKRMVLIGLITLAAVGGWLTGVVTAPYAISKEPRFPQLMMDQLNDKQKPLGEQIMKVSSVGLGGRTIRCSAALYSDRKCSTCFITCAGRPRSR